MKHILIYTDGASSGNPGPSAWCYIALDPQTNRKKIQKGSYIHATNNQMELEAAVHALCDLEEPCFVKLHTDSSYVYECIQKKWYERWIDNGWLTSANEPVKYKNLWISLIKQIKKHRVEFIKVKAHSGDELNCECDRLAHQESQEIKRQIKNHGKKKTFRFRKKK